VLYWLGDTSDGDSATQEFLDRRIDNVLQFQKVKGQIRKSPSLMKILSGPRAILHRLAAPEVQSDLPGYINPTSKENQ
jgi:ubiquinone biosynthesis protein COQ9